MTGLRWARLMVVAVGLVLALAACSGNGETVPGDDPDTTLVAESTTTSVTGSSTTVAEDTTSAPSLREMRDALGIDILLLNPTTETGSHPTLSWSPVDGAMSYWLVLRDADGRPYWAWTGADASIRVGGGESSDTNQTATLHEEMTWSVAAFDEEGNLIALSDAASLAP